MSRKTISGMHFAVYSHKLVVGQNRLITRNFIVLKNEYNIITQFTDFHQYIHSSKGHGAHSISDDGNNRFSFVAHFLNYIFFTNNQEYKYRSLRDIDADIVQQFFYAYGSIQSDGTARTKATVTQCTNAVIDFLTCFVKEYRGRCKLSLSDIAEEEFYYTKRGHKKTHLVPKFDIIYSGVPKHIFRDIPNAVFNLILGYTAENYPQILMLIALSAFAGCRPSEACNVRQEISPLGPGIIIKRIGSEIIDISIDLREEMVLRSDLKPVGFIKKERMQKVYPRFKNVFMFCYGRYKEYLSTIKFEKDYCALSVNKQGKARTYDSYVSVFRKMISELISIMLQSDEEEIVNYGFLLQSNNIGPHIFRHWFSVRLALYGEDIAGLQYWRGDKSPESALVYLQNKSELTKQFQRVSNESFDFMLKQAIERERHE